MLEATESRSTPGVLNAVTSWCQVAPGCLSIQYLNMAEQHFLTLLPWVDPITLSCASWFSSSNIAPSSYQLVAMSTISGTSFFIDGLEYSTVYLHVLTMYCMYILFLPVRHWKVNTPTYSSMTGKILWNRIWFATYVPTICRNTHTVQWQDNNWPPVYSLWCSYFCVTQNLVGAFPRTLPQYIAWQF